MILNSPVILITGLFINPKPFIMKPKIEVPLMLTVKKLLTRHPKLRSNDAALVIEVWQHYHRELKSVHMSFLMFAHKFSMGEYINTESIRRARQILQAKYPELRVPKTDRNRKEYAEEFKEDVINIKNQL